MLFQGSNHLLLSFYYNLKLIDVFELMLKLSEDKLSEYKGLLFPKFGSSLIFEFLKNEQTHQTFLKFVVNGQVVDMNCNGSPSSNIEPAINSLVENSDDENKFICELTPTFEKSLRNQVFDARPENPMIKTDSDDVYIPGLTNEYLLILVYIFGGIFIVALIGVVIIIYMLGKKEK